MLSYSKSQQVDIHEKLVIFCYYQPGRYVDTRKNIAYPSRFLCKNPHFFIVYTFLI